MSENTCEKCKKREGPIYRAYMGKLRRTVGAPEVAKNPGGYYDLQVNTYYEVGGYIEGAICDNCIRREQWLMGVIFALPAVLAFVIAMFPLGKNDWDETDYLMVKVCVILGLVLLAIAGIGFWLYLRFSDKKEKGDTMIARHGTRKEENFREDFAFAAGDQPCVWTTKGYATQFPEGQEASQQ